MKKSFVLYHDFEATLNELSDEQAGKLLRATFAYSARGEIVDYGEIAVKLTMPAVRAQIDRDNEKYDKVCERNRKNGQLGGRKTETQSNPVGSSGVQSNPVGADSDSDSLSDSLSESLSDNQEQEKDNTAPPVGVNELKPKRERKPRSATSIPFADDFATFWESYPRKVARPNAEKAWAKLVKAGELPDMDTLLAAVANQTDAKDWHTDQQFCPHPATWLNGKRWEDAVCASGKPQDTRWQKYRTWASRYAEKRLKHHPGEKYDSPSEIDEAAKVVAEYIAPDAFTEELLGLGIDWLLQSPERCAFVPTLKSLGDFASPAWGSIAGWACNAVRGVDVTASPFETGA